MNNNSNTLVLVANKSANGCEMLTFLNTLENAFFERAKSFRVDLFQLMPKGRLLVGFHTDFYWDE